MSGFRGKAKPLERTVTTPAGRVRIAIPEGLTETAGERTAYLKGFEAGVRYLRDIVLRDEGQEVR